MTLVQLVQTYSTYLPSSAAAAAAAVAGCEGNEVTDEYLLDPLVDILSHTPCFCAAVYLAKWISFQGRAGALTVAIVGGYRCTRSV